MMTPSDECDPSLPPARRRRRNASDVARFGVEAKLEPDADVVQVTKGRSSPTAREQLSEPFVGSGAEPADARIQSSEANPIVEFCAEKGDMQLAVRGGADDLRSLLPMLIAPLEILMSAPGAGSNA